MFYVKTSYDWRTIRRLFRYKSSAQFHSSTDVCSKLYKDLPCGTRHRLETRQKEKDNFLFRILWTMLSNKGELAPPSPLLPRTERIPLYFHNDFLVSPNYFDSHLRVPYKREPNLWLGDKQLGTPVSGSQWRGGTKREKEELKYLSERHGTEGPRHRDNQFYAALRAIN